MVAPLIIAGIAIQALGGIIDFFGNNDKVNNLRKQAQLNKEAADEEARAIRVNSERTRNVKKYILDNNELQAKFKFNQDKQQLDIETQKELGRGLAARAGSGLGVGVGTLNAADLSVLAAARVDVAKKQSFFSIDLQGRRLAVENDIEDQYITGLLQAKATETSGIKALGAGMAQADQLRNQNNLGALKTLGEAVLGYGKEDAAVKAAAAAGKGR